MASEHGFGLESDVKKKREKLHGILNGVDTEVWNPATDKLTDTKYNVEELEGKFENKTVLARQFKMEADVDVPIIGMIGRMVEQKGYDLLLESIDRIRRDERAVYRDGRGGEEIRDSAGEGRKEA